MLKSVSFKDLIFGVIFFLLSFFVNSDYADSAGSCQLSRDKGGFGGECTWWSCKQGYTQVNDSTDCMPGWVCCVKKEDKTPQAFCSGICRDRCEQGEIEDSYGSRSCPVTVAYQQVCCVKEESQLSKNKSFDPQNPPTKQPQQQPKDQPKQETPSTSGRPITSGDTSSSQLVPCTDNCTLCHLYIGVHRIYTYLVWNLLYWIAATTIVIAGLLYMISTGSKLIDAAKRALQYGIGGFLIAVCSWLIITIIMNALGATNAGNWYTFSCDTTPSSEYFKKEFAKTSSDSKVAQSPGEKNTTTDNKSTAPKVSESPDEKKTNSKKGLGLNGYQKTENLSPTRRRVVDAYLETQVGKKYGGDVHCWSTVNEAFLRAGLPGLGNRWEVWDGDLSTVKPGDAMQTKEHTWLVLENGATSSAIPKGYIGVNLDGLRYNIEKARRKGLQIRIIRAE